MTQAIAQLVSLTLNPQIAERAGVAFSTVAKYRREQGARKQNPYTGTEIRCS